ncbi:ADP-ribosylglycohydrolase family protein [Gilvimarinus algae]|uniref:ADP-ribosylglycohydrolase family protein n=1 Tax=Gilvimarinus algae TaxID=3058037 RepID=A0ABT8TBY6_9GAMM|nr:ADP-ribosylglycohydrolase family protein [Gilvimarinus sp. SDUM040014]MDO3381160.1 ADP-ribosylglycohydrolase family protein [Gilvimarinus sp. SDUM040014]
MKSVFAMALSLMLGAASVAGATPASFSVSKAEYQDRLYGFWLGQCIANWSGLVTEMDKIGNIGEIQTGDFYTRESWEQADQPSIWGQGVPSDLSGTIDFVFEEPGGVWGADDDTDIEYLYQYLLAKHQSSLLSAEQIRDGWLTHIYPADEPTPFGKDPDGNYENFLWVSNQRAYELMRGGLLPPATGQRGNNSHYDMIDAQLTTEIFGLYAPARPDIARQLADLPVRTTADAEAVDIALFYVTLYSLAGSVAPGEVDAPVIEWMAGKARELLPDGQYPAAMYDFVYRQYRQGIPWEQTRDAVYLRYQVEQADGYDVTTRNLYCNGCFAAGINFAASLISLFYGEGDIKETIKIAMLVGWDADNPAATWGGLLGFMLGREGVEAAFDRRFAEQFFIHRTRRHFPNNGLDNFPAMAAVGAEITERVIKEQMRGEVQGDRWAVPEAVRIPASARAADGDPSLGTGR